MHFRKPENLFETIAASAAKYTGPEPLIRSIMKAYSLRLCYMALRLRQTKMHRFVLKRTPQIQPEKNVHHKYYVIHIPASKRIENSILKTQTYEKR